MYKKILCPVDLEINCANALEHAFYLANMSGGEITVIHANPDVLSDDEEVMVRVSLEEFHQKEKECVKTALKKIEALLQYGKIPEYSKSVVHHTKIIPSHRSEVQALLNYAEDHDYDLIVIRAHTHSKAYEMLIGGVAEKIVRHASCPVLVVRGD